MMKHISAFLKRPRNVYFSIIVMLTLVTGLVSISFSYYVPDTGTDGLLKFKRVDNRIQSDELVDGKMTLAPHETRVIKVFVMSNNDFTSSFKLYYKTDSNLKVFMEVPIEEKIDAKEVQTVELMVSNFEDIEADVFIGIESAEKIEEIVVDGNLVDLIEN